jgi:hypothetical protein
VAIVSFTLYAQARANHSYAVLRMGVMSLFVMFDSLLTPNATLSLAVYRGLEIIVGATAVSLVDMLLAPYRGNPRRGAAKPGVFSTSVDEDQPVIAKTAGLAIASAPSIWKGLQLPGLDQAQSPPSLS